jgi:threonine synthase
VPSRPAIPVATLIICRYRNTVSSPPPATSSPEQARGIIDRYRAFLPVSDTTPIIALGEGNTPLIHSPRLSQIVGRECDVFIKYEGLNPTGSFKDRGMTVAVSKAIEQKARALICASTGNTSASAAAYAARAGILAVVILPAGKIASGKLVQAVAYGARIVAIDGNFDDALRLVREIGDREDFAIVNSINPDRIAGQKTAAYEIVDTLGDAPRVHILPVGNAGNITAYWAGYRDYAEAGKATSTPVMLGFQAAGAAPIFYDKVIEHPETIASAIRIGNPASWKSATAAFAESKGAVDIVTDQEILEAQSWLARSEGIFVEPASAASVAGLFKCCRESDARFSLKNISARSKIVCTVTGHGLKDPDPFLDRLADLRAVPSRIDDILAAIDL